MSFLPSKSIFSLPRIQTVHWPFSHPVDVICNNDNLSVHSANTWLLTKEIYCNHVAQNYTWITQDLMCKRHDFFFYCSLCACWSMGSKSPTNLWLKVCKVPNQCHHSASHNLFTVLKYSFYSNVKQWSFCFLRLKLCTTWASPVFTVFNTASTWNHSHSL